MRRLTLPTTATVALALLAGAATVVNQVFHVAEPWHTGITVALVFIAGLGIGPLTGAAFRAALHLSAGLATVITAIVSAAALLAVSASIDSTAKAVILGLLTLVAGLGFAPVPALGTTIPVATDRRVA